MYMYLYMSGVLLLESTTGFRGDAVATCPGARAAWTSGRLAASAKLGVEDLCMMCPGSLSAVPMYISIFM